ncbi:MAG: hypothetical protein H6721_25210 [Sandaracinus sp.]|nr:hypothetical protein [Sandaracinus sp.]
MQEAIGSNPTACVLLDESLDDVLRGYGGSALSKRVEQWKNAPDKRHRVALLVTALRARILTPQAAIELRKSNAARLSLSASVGAARRALRVAAGRGDAACGCHADSAMRGELGEWLRGFVFEGGFLARYPYYAHVIAGLDAVRDPSVERMAVSFRRVPGRGGRFFLHVNVEAVAREPQFVRGLLLHEVHHVVLGHLTHPKYFGVAHPELLSMAMEASANEYVDEALPSPLLWEHFREVGFRARQSTMERYELLVAARADGEEPRPSRPSRTLIRTIG